MKTTCVLALVMLMSAAGVSAADKDKDSNDKPAASDNNNQKKKPAVDPNKVVCHTDQATGSRTRINRVCHTRAEWEEIAEQTRRDMNDFSRNASLTGPAKNPLGPG